MNIIIVKFWDAIANDIEKKYKRGHPGTWSKRDIDLFIPVLLQEVINACKKDESKAENCKIPFINGKYHYSNLSISYDTIRRILLKRVSGGQPETQEMFAIYVGASSVQAYLDEKGITVDNNERRDEEYIFSSNRLGNIYFELLKVSEMDIKEKERVIYKALENGDFNLAKQFLLQLKTRDEDEIDFYQKELSKKKTSLGNKELQLALIAFINSDYSLAYMHLQKAIQYCPEEHDFYNRLGYCCQKLGKIEEALLHFEKALELCQLQALKQEIIICENNLALSYIDLNRIEEARSLLEKNLESIDSLDEQLKSTIYSNLGVIYSKLGNYQQAKELIERAIFLEKRNKGSSFYSISSHLTNLSFIYQKLRDKPNVVKSLQEALKIDLINYATSHPNIAQLRYLLALAYEEAGAINKAIDELESTYILVKSNLHLSKITIFIKSIYKLGMLLMYEAIYDKSFAVYSLLENIFLEEYGRTSLQYKYIISLKEFSEKQLF